MKKIIKYLIETYFRTVPPLGTIFVYAMTLHAILLHDNKWNTIAAIGSIGYFMFIFVLLAIYLWLSKEESD